MCKMLILGLAEVSFKYMLSFKLRSLLRQDLLYFHHIKRQCYTLIMVSSVWPDGNFEATILPQHFA